MSYYRRGYNWEQIHYLGAPVGGWNPDANSWELPENQAPILDNFLIRPGKLTMRGPIAVVQDLSAYAPLSVCGWAMGRNWMYLTSRATAAMPEWDQWNAPLVQGGIVKPLNAAGGTMVVLSGAGAGSAHYSPGNHPGPRSIVFDGLRYGIYYDAVASAVDINNLYTVWCTQLYTVPIGAVTSTAQPTFTTLAGAPQAALDVYAYQSRIWVLGGIDVPGGGTVFEGNALFFTNPISAGGGGSTSDWKDPVTSLTNKILVTDSDGTDFGTALATCPRGLLIFKNRSIQLLRGTTTANYTLVPLSREVGCLDARSVLETDSGVYFISHKGLMVTDGARTVNVSGTVTYTLRAALAVYEAERRNGYGAYAQCVLVSDGSILVTIGTGQLNASGAPTNSVQPIWSALYNPQTHTWTRITSAIWGQDGTILQAGNEYPSNLIQLGSSSLYVVGDKYVSQLESVDTTVAPTTSTNGTLTWSDSSSNGGDTPWTSIGDPNDSFEPTPSFVDFASGTHYSHFLLTEALGLSIPAAATITGIVVTITRESGNGNASDWQVKLVKAGTAVGNNKAVIGTAWPTSYADQSYGSPTDLWGATWTVADLNDPTFGVALSVTGNNDQAFVLYVRVTVYYTVPSATTVTLNSFVRSTGLYDKLASGQYSSIPARWRTKLLPIVGTSTLSRKFGQAKRFFLDYVFTGVGLVAGSGWSVTPKNASGAAYAAAEVMAASSSGISLGSVNGFATDAVPEIQRQNVDFANEISDVCFDITWSDPVSETSAPSNVSAELYGVGVEYQPTRDLR